MTETKLQGALASLPHVPYCIGCGCYHVPGTPMQIMQTGHRAESNGILHPAGTCRK